MLSKINMKQRIKYKDIMIGSKIAFVYKHLVQTHYPVGLIKEKHGKIE